MIDQAPGGIGGLIRSVVPLAVVLGVLAAVLVAWGFRNGPERHWLFSVIQYAPYPVFLLPFLVLVAAAFLAGRVWVLLALAGLIFVATEVMDLEIHMGVSGSNRIRVLTFTDKDDLARREPFGLADIANEIARHDPDIFVLQDARSFQQGVIDPTFARGLFGDVLCVHRMWPATCAGPSGEDYTFFQRQGPGSSRPWVRPARRRADRLGRRRLSRRVHGRSR